MTFYRSTNGVGALNREHHISNVDL